MVYIILGIVAILIVIFVITFIYNKNQFQEFLIRIDEAETNIDLLLQKKMELILKMIPIIKQKTKEKEFLEDFSSIEKEELTHFRLNEYLKNSYVEIAKILDDNETLLNEKEFHQLLEEFNDNEDDLNASINFYNDNTTEYNHLIQSFPSNIIKLFLKLKYKDLYSTEKKEIYEILNEQ